MEELIAEMQLIKTKALIRWIPKKKGEERTNTKKRQKGKYRQVSNKYHDVKL